MCSALVYRNQALIDSGQPATHVLLVGVGNYPHLNDGDGNLAVEHGEMGQLSSPPVSAYAIADWFLDKFNNPAKPLASVSLLVSGKEIQPYQNARLDAPVMPVAATYPNLKAAVDEWYLLCDGSEGNLAMFWFCGHGVARGMVGPSLLLEDYGASKITPMDGAVDFSMFHRGMNRCAARQQCFFIDACREVSEVVLNTSADGQVLVQDSTNRPYTDGRDFRVYYAAIEGAAAYGRKNNTSHFTEELIRGLNGCGSHNMLDNDKWWVSTGRLQEWLHWGLMKRPGKPKVPAGELQGAFEFHLLSATPMTPFYVGCDPNNDNDAATLSCKADGNVIATRAPAPKEWLVEVPSCVLYDFEATDGVRRAEVKARYAMPPYINVPLRMEP
ncbi:MAG: caspase family protein [Gammaproteobacteria bacterium]|nr:caspase family protein [Gammaproteobacteria bacterium]